MDRKADLPAPPQPSASKLVRPLSSSSAADVNLTYSSSSSSSSSSFSSNPDFLRQVHAAFKRHRPLGNMQSKVFRPSPVLAQPIDSSSNSTSSSVIEKKINTGASRDVSRLVKVIPEEGRAAAAAEVACGSSEDSPFTPPSLTGVTIIEDEKIASFGSQEREAKLLTDRNCLGLAIPSSQIASTVVLASGGSNKDDLTFQKGYGYQGIATDVQHQIQKIAGNIEVPGARAKFEGPNMMENKKEIGHNRQFVEPKTQCSIAGSSCPTTLSLYTSPTFEGTNAPGVGQTAFSTQKSSSKLELPPGIQSHAIPDEKVALVKSDHQDNIQNYKSTNDKLVSSVASSLPSQVPPKTDSSLGNSKSSKIEKTKAKKKYDSDIFFKVNGKKYQKLGKIGSGGSSEVYKVISADCTIYALKKIKLRGRDYPTAYGFCQEIKYLNKLKGKNNIIQLIDYEVTDKGLLQEVNNSSLTMKDRRIKDDECIYMVLEYGEIDLAHMLSHKWKETTSGCRINENWLRFYWQQMLEAVNTIHEERIVHSDLKPANFLLVRGSLKLIDFGIAKAIMSDTTNIQREAQVGTLNYMSPEAFMCNEPDANGNTIKCGRPSDIWSLGCILYQMVYGKTPFAEYKTFWAKFKVVTNRNHEIVYEPLPNPWLIDLMQRCLAWDRNERWRIPQLLQHPFLVPNVPRGVPTLHNQNHPCKLLMEKVAVHWTDPEVSRLCSELHEVLAKLERTQTNPTK